MIDEGNTFSSRKKTAATAAPNAKHKKSGIASHSNGLKTPPDTVCPANTLSKTPPSKIRRKTKAKLTISKRILQILSKSFEPIETRQRT
jgi:hypothetical protein